MKGSCRGGVSGDSRAGWAWNNWIFCVGFLKDMKEVV